MTTLITRARKRVAFLTGVMTFMLAVSVTVAGPAPPAEASAYGVSGWGWITYQGKGLPRGLDHVYLSGSGTYVNYVKAWPYMTTPLSGTICNWNVTAEFFDSSGRWYKTYTGPKHYTCNSYYKQANADKIFIYQTMRPGFMCSTLKSNGSRVTSVCHNIN